MPHQTTQHKESMEAARNCYEVCTETIAHCLQQGGKHVEAEHLQLLMDCANMCKTCWEACLHEGPATQHTMKACAEIANACADSCEQVGDDEHMKRCVEACRACAQACGGGSSEGQRTRPARTEGRMEHGKTAPVTQAR